MMYNRLGSRRFVSVVAALHAAAIAGTSFYGTGSAARIVPLSNSHGPWKPHQGAQEIARRRRQILRGQLTTSNGLALK